MIIKFIKNYKHTIKSFKKDDVVRVMPDFGKELIKKKVAIEESGEFKEDYILKKIMEENDGK